MQALLNPIRRASAPAKSLEVPHDQPHGIWVFFCHACQPGYWNWL